MFRPDSKTHAERIPFRGEKPDAARQHTPAALREARKLRSDDADLLRILLDDGTGRLVRTPGS